MAVVVPYRLFGLTLAAIFALVRIVVTSVTIFLTIRIPFKRNYHWMFVVLGVSFLYFVFFEFAAELTTDAATALAWYHVASLADSSVLFLLITQFVMYFVSPKMARWQKYVLLGGYGFVAVTRWAIPRVFPNFLQTTPRLTATGWAIGPGTSTPYLVPFGVDVFPTLMAILALFLLVRYYHSEKSDLVRGQTKYLIVGIIFLLAGLYYHYLVVSTVTIFGIPLPSMTNLIDSAGDLVLLLGLRKKGFFSVTPTTELAAGYLPEDARSVMNEASIKLLDGHSYLGLSQRESFLAFCDQIKGGRSGLCVTTIPPEEVRREYGLHNTPILWLASSRRKDVVDPSDLAGLSAAITNFIKKSGIRPVVLLDGLDYLISKNGFRPTMMLVSSLNKTSLAKDGIIIVSSPLGAESEEEREPSMLELFEEEFPIVQGRVRAPRAVEVGEAFQIHIDLFNVGKRTAFVETVEDIVPTRSRIVGQPGRYGIKGQSVVMNGKQLEPFQLETISLSFEAKEPGDEVLQPKIDYRDGRVVHSSHNLEPIAFSITPQQSMEFEAKESESVFTYLAREFREDYMIRKRAEIESGWRNLIQVSKGTGIPQSTLYGAQGRYGRPIFELLSRGLIEEKLFAQGRGRVRETAKFRVSYEKEPVRRFVDRAILRSKPQK